MNIAEAKGQLMVLACGKYHSIKYTVVDYGNGTASQKCEVYIDDHGSCEAGHWEEALSDMASRVNGKPLISEDMPLSQKASAEHR